MDTGTQYHCDKTTPDMLSTFNDVIEILLIKKHQYHRHRKITSLFLKFIWVKSYIIMQIFALLN